MTNLDRCNVNRSAVQPIAIRKQFIHYFSNEGVMNQVGNSKIPPSGHLILVLPTYAMKIKPAKFKKMAESA
jgi:hypothetical protein